MLEQAIQEMRGEPVAEKIDTEIKIPVSALIPRDFVPLETERLHLYKRLFAADGEDNLRTLRQEVVDRYGALPAELALLFKIARLKQQLRRLGALRLTSGKGVFELRIPKLADAQVDRLLKVAVREPERYRIAPDGKLLLFQAFPERPSLAEQDLMLGQLMALVDPLVAAVVG